MAAQRHKKSAAGKKSKKTLWSSLVLLIIGFFAWAIETYGIPGQNIAPAAGTLPEEGILKVWFTSIGQADCQLIQTPSGKYILIDAGEAATGEELVLWLKQQGVETLEAVIATHPHADHIGGMADVIWEFPIYTFYMPRVDDKQTPTTRVYESMLEALSEKNLKATAAKADMILFEEEGVALKCLSPVSETYDSLNNYSVVCSLTYGKRSFLFTGDAEAPVEKEILANNSNLSADVLKCGHHGSSTSTSAAFLKQVSPAWAVISCGIGNDYGHPHEEIIKRLNKAGVKMYRTDTQGTILASCDGNSISFEINLPAVAS